MYLILLLLTYLVSAQVKPGLLPPGEVIWPRPNDLTLGNKVNLCVKSLHFSLTHNTPLKHPRRAVQIYKPLVYLYKKQDQCQEVTSITIDCTTCEKDDEPIRTDLTDSSLHLDLYSLSITETGEVIVTALNYFGVLRGLDSFAQLSVAGIIEAAPISIKNDEPEFRYRGVMLDTSRHYLPVSSIKETIDGLMASKMNALHLHLTDSESFPLILPNLPELAGNAAYSKEETYSPEMIADLIQYATERGVVIIPEIDMPAHAYSWWKSFPDIVSCPDMLSPSTVVGQLDPRIEKTYTITKQVIDDVIGLFSESPIIHLGFDEALYYCWGVTKQEALTMQTEFLDNLDDYLKSKKEKLLIAHWDDVAAENIYDRKGGRRIYQNWKGLSNLEGIFKNSDSQVIVSASEVFYFDGGQANHITGRGMNWDSPRKTWRLVYDFALPSDLKQYVPRVMGAEACLWGEGHDEANVIQDLFPRLAALGENQWTKQTLRDGKDPYARLIQHRNLLVWRGVAAEPLQPESCQVLNKRGRDGACHWN